ncbi:MAG: CBS domain-containing protein [Pirellulaceae bacterium]
MNLREILRSKGSTVYTISPDASLMDAVRMMVDHRCGSLVVTRDGTMVGLISERDILRTLADERSPLAATPISDRMTTHVVTGSPDDGLGQVMGILTQNRIRHLPVLQDGRLEGMVSIGDVVKAQHEQLARENHFLMSYIQS